MGKGGDGKGKGKGKQKGKGKGKSKKGGDGEDQEGAAGVVTELHTAAREGNLEQLETVLSDDEKKDMLNAFDQHRRTPLHLAAFFGKTEAVEKLLEKGADPQLVAMDGFLPLHFAAQAGNLEVLRLIVKKLGSKGEHGVIKRHVNRVVSKGKRSALHLAVQKGHAECAKFLAMKAASTEAKTAQGQTALDLCQDEELRNELAGHAKKAKEEEEENGENETPTEVAEPPAKKRAVEAADAPGTPAAVPVAVDAPPMRSLPAQPNKPSSVPGLLCGGPLRLAEVKLQPDVTEKSYPAGVPAMADVEWDLKVKEEPGLTDGPVWCLQGHEEDQSAKQLTLKIQKSSKRLLHYTHFSDEALMIAKEARCNACGLLFLIETGDGLLLMERQEEGSTSLSRSGSLTSQDLTRAISEALAPLALPQEAASAALGSARLLGLLDVGDEAPHGHRHELVIGLRLPKTAAEVKGLAGGIEGLVFVSSPGVEATAPDATLSLEEILSESSKLPHMHQQAVKLLQALRANA